ncbi:glycerophosphoryl diester phosphodiesterase membrane domain-containing protein [Massilicoli timonensis]|uniref:Glycerophosphoryl diester phosphodiesterase membrane domain-containing protein n=1 Tax=Massilicoli timonensis TaxID=2015901 RepID=A0ABT1SJ33_9FIRM|nr:glycerophosphodiester phosphodiesterase family protein [Massilicoli timonensis]MCQ5121234.1 glycerophosphoryl diester phosphodiesterase membrane domain-containing protein [Massilicoli timonensis]
MKEIIKFELFYKALMFLVVLPFLSLIEGLYTRYVIGVSAIYNFDMVYFLLGSVSGIIALIVSCIVVLCFIYFEYAVLYKLIFLYKSKSVQSWREVFWSSFVDLKDLKSVSSIFLFLLFVLLNPLWHLYFTSSFLPEINIPSFVINELIKMDGGSILVIIGYTLLFIFYGFLCFVPIYYILTKDSLLKSIKKSINVMKKNYKIWGLLILLFVVNYVLDTFVFRELPLKNGDFNFYFLRYFVLSFSFKIRSLIFIIDTILWTSIEILFIYKQLSYVDEAQIKCSFTRLYELNIRKINIKERLLRHKLLYGFLFTIGIVCFVIFYFNQYPLLHKPYSIGHRGDISAVENTIDGVLAADQNNADYAEIDIQMTKDRHLIVCHDTNLKRLAGVDKEIKDLTLKEIKQITIFNKAGDKSNIPTLEETIIAAKESKNGIGLLIEFKPLSGDLEDTVNQTIDLIEKYDFSEKAMFMSMNEQCVELLAKKRPDWWIGYCAFGNVGRMDIKLNDPFIPDFIAVEEGAINTQFLEDARNRVLPVYVWTVDDYEKVIDYLRMGVSGVIGDSSDQVTSAVDEYLAEYDEENEYLTTCPGFPKLTDDEYEYIQCE